MKRIFEVRKLFGLGAVLLSMFVLAACAGGASPVLPAAGGTPTVPAAGTTAVLPETGATPGSSAASAPVKVQLKEYVITMPSSLPAGRTVFEVSNVGTEEHGFEIEGQGLETGLEQHLQPGETATLEVDLAAGSYVVYCPVDDHRGEGMQVDLTVTAP